MPEQGTLKVKVGDGEYGGGGTGVPDPTIAVGDPVLVSQDFRTANFVKIAYARPGVVCVIWSCAASDGVYRGGLFARAVRLHPDGSKTMGEIANLGATGSYFGSPISADPWAAVHVAEGLVAVGVRHYQGSVWFINVHESLWCGWAHKSTVLGPQASGAQNNAGAMASDGRGRLWVAGLNSFSDTVSHRVSIATGGTDGDQVYYTIEDGPETSWQPTRSVPPMDAAWATDSDTVVCWEDGTYFDGYGGLDSVVHTVSVSGLTATPTGSVARLGAKPSSGNFQSSLIPGAAPGTVDVMVLLGTSPSHRWYLFEGLWGQSLSVPDPYAVSTTGVQFLADGTFADYNWLTRPADKTFLAGYPSGTGFLSLRALNTASDWVWNEGVTGAYNFGGYQGAYAGDGLWAAVYLDTNNRVYAV